MARETGNGNSGRVTLRDLMKLQKLIYDEVGELKDAMSNLKVKVALISGSVAVIVTIVTILVKGAIAQ